MHLQYCVYNYQLYVFHDIYDSLRVATQSAAVAWDDAQCLYKHVNADINLHQPPPKPCSQAYMYIHHSSVLKMVRASQAYTYTIFPRACYLNPAQPRDTHLFRVHSLSL